MAYAQVQAQIAQAEALHELAAKLDGLTAHVQELEHAAHFGRGD